ncbi:MAG TPA: hypothetical protein PKD18_02350 [Saprospiraceae bacterium]|nr:hypothetical protein [Saprospiraceae bacterium]
MVNSNLKLIWSLALSFSCVILIAQETFEGYKSFASLKYPEKLVYEEIIHKPQVLPMIHMDEESFFEHLEESTVDLIDKKQDKIKILMTVKRDGKITDCMAGSLNGSAIDTISLKNFVDGIEPLQPAKQREHYVNIQVFIIMEFKKGKVVDYELHNLLLSE